MKKILVCVPFTEEQRDKLQKAAKEIELIFVNPKEVTKELIKSVQGVIGNVPANVLAENQKLEWVQLNSSGADSYIKEGILGENTILTSATGAYGLGIAEYMVAMTLVMMKKIPEYFQAQQEHVWSDMGMVTGLYGKRILIVGMGDIGSSFAKRLVGFECQVVGMKRTAKKVPDYLDELYTMECLEREIAKADVVALCLPETTETKNLFHKKMLQKVKKGSYFINVGRGSTVVMDDLIQVAKEDHFAGIWLDVCNPEPLSPENPLWDMKNVLITPHITGGFHLDYTLNQIFSICYKNLCSYAAGEKKNYKSVIDRNTGYAKHLE